eukprot:COSAG06_NODE_208_length_20182_cov_31.214759_20_plen_156_part_00
MAGSQIAVNSWLRLWLNMRSRIHGPGKVAGSGSSPQRRLICAASWHQQSQPIFPGAPAGQSFPAGGSGGGSGQEQPSGLANRTWRKLWISRSVQAEQGRVVSGGGEEPGAPYKCPLYHGWTPGKQSPAAAMAAAASDSSVVQMPSASAGEAALET